LFGASSVGVFLAGAADAREKESEKKKEATLAAKRIVARCCARAIATRKFSLRPGLIAASRFQA
jgi:hypothetical protein